jgi:hypothetical protein
MEAVFCTKKESSARAQALVICIYYELMEFVYFAWQILHLRAIML